MLNYDKFIIYINLLKYEIFNEISRIFYILIDNMIINLLFILYKMKKKIYKN